MSWRTASKVKWLRALPGVSEDEPLASRTSFGIGGPAEFFVEMSKPQAIEEVLKGAAERDIPYMLLGAGTNLLIADAGIEGLVVRVVNRDFHVEGRQLRAGAGLKMMRLARIAADAGLVGFEFAIGVPGTVGGAVYQNAGAWNKEMREVIVEVEGFMPGAGRKTWNPVDLHFRYRSSALRDGALKGGLVIQAKIQLERGDGEAAKALMAKLTKERNETQPIKTKNCGSVFKNPHGDSAGRLVQAAGLKGAREGKAVVSSLHGNFIINEGHATAAEMLQLIARIQATARNERGIELETEVQIVGEEA